MTLALITALFVPFITAFVLVRFLFRTKPLDLFTTCALAYPLGLGIISFSLFMLGACHIPLTLPSVYGVLALVILAELILLKPRVQWAPVKPQALKEENDVAALGLFILVVCAVIYVFAMALNYPVAVWDEMERVVLKAKMMVDDHSLDSLVFSPHPSYPLHIELNITWLAFHFSEWEDQWIKILSPLFFISFLRIQYFFSRQWTNRRWAYLGLLILIMSPLMMHQATLLYCDFPLMVYNVGVLMLLGLWFKTKNEGFFVVASLFAALAAFTKLEATFYLPIYGLYLIWILRYQDNMGSVQKIKAGWKFFFPAIVVCVCFYAYKMAVGIPLTERVGFDFSVIHGERFVEVLKAFGDDLFLTGHWGMSWILLAISLILGKDHLRIPEIRWLLMALGLFFALLFLQFTLTPNYQWLAYDRAHTILSRLLLHSYPLVPILFVLLSSRLKKDTKERF